MPETRPYLSSHDNLAVKRPFAVPPGHMMMLNFGSIVVSFYYVGSLGTCLPHAGGAFFPELN